MVYFLFCYQSASKIDSLDPRLTIYGFLDCLTFSMDVTEIDSGCKKIYAPPPHCALSQERSCNSSSRVDQCCCVLRGGQFLHSDCMHNAYTWGMLSYFNYFFGHLRNINLYISPTVKDAFRYRRQEDVWVSRGYCNKPLQAWWLKTTEMYSLTVLEARGLKATSFRWQPHSPGLGGHHSSLCHLHIIFSSLCLLPLFGLSQFSPCLSHKSLCH